LAEQQSGEFAAPDAPEGPRSARAEQRAQERVPDSEKIDGLLSPTGLTLGQQERRGQALGMAKQRLLEKENRAAQQKADAESPERKRLIDFSSQCLAQRQNDPKATSKSVIEWSDIVRDSKSKPIGEMWQRITATGAAMPARTAGQVYPT
jgi:hypothetical protein